MSTLPLTFDALAVPHAGAPIARQKRTVTSLAEGELLVRVDFASLNRMDPGLAARNVFELPEPYVLGFDFSGEVVEAGPGVSALRAGEAVFGRTDRGGCFAEYVVARAENVLRRGSMPADAASTYGIAYLTAYESLMLTAKIPEHAGQWLFIPGAGGGVGHFAAQLARAHGLKVIGSAGKEASLRVLRELHLEAVVDYAKEDVIAAVLRLTGGRGAELVYDSTYTQSSFEQSAQVVAAGGDYIRLGTEQQLSTRGARDMSSVVEARGAKLVVADLGRYGREPRYQARMPEVMEGQQRPLAWYDEGKVRPVITGTVPFEAAALQRAFEDFFRGTTNVGKVVVDCRTRRS